MVSHTSVEKNLLYPTWGEAVRYWLKLGCISFGGPAGQISLMHKELVERRRWISDEHFLQALNFCMLLPGPEAQQLATYLGWRLHGAKGGLAAGGLFVLPSAVLIFFLSWLYVVGGDWPWLNGLFYGLSVVVTAVVAEAIIRIGKKALKSSLFWVLAVTAFVAIFFFDVSFLWIILLAAAIGFWGKKWAPELFPSADHHGPAASAKGKCFLNLPAAAAPSWQRAGQIILLGLILWGGPILLLGQIFGWMSTPTQQALFFSQAAVVTFGGAYAVLPYVAQQAVEKYAWLTHGQMMTGLGLAESTPGPLIMVLQFVGFIGGWQHPGSLSPLGGALIGALITTWVTFIPSFLMVFLGAPYVEKIRQRPQLNAALSAMTAAVVGVILNLAVKFAQHTFFPAAGSSPDWLAMVLAVAAFVALVWKKLPIIHVIGAGAIVGLAWKLLS